VNVIDDRGIAAGIADLDLNGTSEGALWGPSGATHGLGFFPGADFSWILGTNGLGDYTGIASLRVGDPFPHRQTGQRPPPELTPFGVQYCRNPRGQRGAR
jgi:hypothetical protein